MTHDEMIAVIQAHKEEKEIQLILRGSEAGVWINTKHPIWDFNTFDYRVKPQPREVWIAEYKDGTLGDFAYKTPTALNFPNRKVRFIEAPETPSSDAKASNT